MARLVAAFGSSHSIMLVSQREDWQHGFRTIDPKNPHYYDRAGNPTSYEALLAVAPKEAEAMVTPDGMGERWDQAEATPSSSLRRRSLRAPALPVIPLIVNPSAPPNQPTPRRCVQLGAALRDQIAAYPEDLRVGVLASGGLSHFVVDEELDRGIIE